MEFMLLVEDWRGEAPRARVSPEEMAKFGRELAERGVLRGSAGPLRPDAEAVRVQVRNGRSIVTHGPFAEAGAVAGGYFVVDVADRAAAIEVAKSCPYARAGVIEVRSMRYGSRSETFRSQSELEATRRAARSPQFLFLYVLDPEATGPEEPRVAKMMAATDELRRQGKHLAGARLPPEVPAARVEIRAEKVLVHDGPFAETKEVIGGFALIRAADRAEAIEIAKSMPHSGWGTTEVREVGRRGAQ